MQTHGTTQKIHYTLRIAAAMCFIGHGSFGIITKAIWCNYFAVFGMGHNMAYTLMPWLGSFDIICGIIILVYPIRAVLVWLVVWGTITAALRPLSGEPFAELIERAGNFGAPLALLLLSGFNITSPSQWLQPVKPGANVSAKALSNVTLCLSIAGFLLLIGHGWLNLIEKKGLIGQYSALGFQNPVQAAHIIGIIEIVAACLVGLHPFRFLILVFLLWKIVSEFFYPHYELFEWIERGGSYGVLLALWFATNNIQTEQKVSLAIQ